MLFNTVFSVLAVAYCVAGVPLEARGVVNHDSLSPWAESVRGGGEGAGIIKFEPLLHIAHGCQPYTAVNPNGDTSGGLKDTGSSTGGCRDTGKGQTYVRASWHKGRYGIMYAWYFPKDMPNSGVSAGAHRHDWENVVVWLNNPAVASPTVIGAAASGHGIYKKVSGLPQNQNGHPLVEYFTNFPTNHELQFKSTIGRDYPMLDWDMMTPAARTALQNADFGKANVPFKDGSFTSNLAKAWI